MKSLLLILASTAVILGAIWFAFEPTFEPAITFILGLVTLLGIKLSSTKEGSNQQTQILGNNSSGNQAGGSININTENK